MHETGYIGNQIDVKFYDYILNYDINYHFHFASSF